MTTKQRNSLMVCGGILVPCLLAILIVGFLQRSAHRRQQAEHAARARAIAVQWQEWGCQGGEMLLARAGR